MTSRTALRHRDFRLLFVGQTISTLGTQTAALGFPLLALHLTGSPARAGVLGFVAGLPVLVLQLPAGALVDRYDRRGMMIGCDAARLALMLALPVAAWCGVLTFALLAVVAVLHAALSVVFTLAQSAALPRLVPPEDLSRAITVNQTGMAATTLGGQPLGGWLFGLAPSLPFVANAVSYGTSLATLLGIRSRLDPGNRPAARRSVRREVAEGLRYVAAHPLLRALTALSAAITLVSGGFTLVVIVLLGHLGATPERVGLVLGACGAAGLLGALATPRLLARIGAGRLYVAALGATALLACSLALAPSVLWAGAAAAAIVALGPPVSVVLQTARARSIPRDLFARVRSVESFAASATAPFASLLAGLSLGRFGPATTCALLGGALAIVTVVAAASSAVRRMSDAEPVHEAA